MTYPADPGGIFASDAHRRVLGHLPTPGSEPILVYSDANVRAKELRRVSLLHRMAPDQSTDFTEIEELESVLSDLEADGYAAQNELGWSMTQAGFDALTGPNKED